MLRHASLSSPTVQQALDLLGPRALSLEGRPDASLLRPTPVTAKDAGEGSFAFAEGDPDQVAEMLAGTRCRVVFCAPDVARPSSHEPELTLVRCSKPRICFILILQAFFGSAPQPGISENAFIHPQARVSNSAHVGPGAVLGRCIIGEGCVVNAGAVIGDDVTLGKRVIVGSNASIGMDGFHFHQDEDGSLLKFPHLGGVRIADDVEIGSNACIARGTLEDTLIGEGTKIDNLVHVAHTAIIGRRCRIAASVLIAGNVSIGDDVWIGPSVCISNNLRIGDKASLTLGSVVAANVAPGARVTGHFAVEHTKFLQMHAAALRLATTSKTVATK